MKGKTEIDENAALQKLSAFGAQFMASLGVEQSPPKVEQEQSSELSTESSTSDYSFSSEDSKGRIIDINVLS
jgi:hypothetical protein